MFRISAQPPTNVPGRTFVFHFVIEIEFLIYSGLGHAHHGSSVWMNHDQSVQEEAPE